MDERLGLGPEDLSPALVEKVVRHGGKDSFAEAAADLKEDLGLDLDGKQVQRITERVGGEWAEKRTHEVEQFKQGRLERTYGAKPRGAAVMVDAGRLLTRAAGAPPGVHGVQWRGPRYACCLSLDTGPQATDPQPEPPKRFLDRQQVARIAQEVQSRAGVPTARAVAGSAPAPAPSAGPRKKRRRRRRGRARPRLVRTAVASLMGAAAFGYLVAAEVHRRGLDLAEVKAYVCDGELCNWTIWEEHFQRLGFWPILDFLHLLTHLYGAAQAAGGSPEECWERYGQWLRWAWRGQREKVWAAVSAAAHRVGAPRKGDGEQHPRSVLARTVTYLENNLGRMDYPKYRKLGLPISSAPVESLIKQFNRRMKGTEKFWTEKGAEAVLQVRAAQLSEDGRTARYWNSPRPRYRAVGRNRLALAG